MGNSVSSLWGEDQRFVHHVSLSAEEVKDLWKKEGKLDNNQRRRRYKCGKKYVVGNLIRPFDLDIIPAVYEIIPRIQQQVRQELHEARLEELREAFEKDSIKTLREELKHMTEPDSEHTACRPFIKDITDKHILAILSTTHFNVPQASKFLLAEVLEDLIMTKFKKLLKAKVDALPAVPVIPFPKNNQINCLVHHEWRTQEQALEVWDKVVAVINKVYESSGVTLQFSDVYRLLRNVSWKVDSAVNFHFKDVNAYKELRPVIIENYHKEDRKGFDSELAHTILRRTDFNLEEAEKLYGVELKRRWSAVEELKEGLKEAGVDKFPSDRSLYYNLVCCFWDVALAKDKFDFNALSEYETKYAKDLKERQQRDVDRQVATKNRVSGDESVVNVDVIDEEEVEDMKVDTTDLMGDDDKTSAQQVIEDMEKKEAHRRLLLQDGRDRDVAVKPNNVPCEANTEINKLVSFYHGDVTTLEVDAVWHPIPDTRVFTATGEHIFSAAGGRLLQEYEAIKKLDSCKSYITRGYNLPAKYVIHTILPSDHNEAKLQACYESVLALVKEHKLKTIAFIPISEATKTFPRYKGIHIGVVTSRVWIDIISNRRSVDRIIFCTNTPEDSADYKRIMSFYYPGPNMDSDILQRRYADFRRLYVREDAQFAEELKSLRYEVKETHWITKKTSHYSEEDVESKKSKKTCGWF